MKLCATHFEPDRCRIMTRVAWVTVACLVTQMAAAAAPEIHVAVGAEEVYVGDNIDYQVEIRNIQDPPAPDISSLKESFDVVPNGNQSRNQQSISIINGKVTEQVLLSHIYRYRLTPKSAGNLIIPPASITIDGKTLTSGEISIKVIAPEEQDLVIAEMTADPLRVYPTQPFTVTLKILVRPLPNNNSIDPLTPLQRQPPHIQVNWVDPPTGLTANDKSSWLQPLLAEDGIGFTLNEVNTRTNSFFDSHRSAVFNLQKGRETVEGVDGDNIRYFAYELSRTLTPEKTGTFSLGPAIIKGTFVSGVERREYQGRRLVTIAPAVTVEVREVPSPRPATFCGGIGDFKVAASASPLKLRVGDPLTLTLDIQKNEHSGSLELVSAPDLSAIDELAENFDLVDKNPTGRIEGSVKRFSYGLRPKRAGVQIPSLTVTTFDPKTESFHSISTPAIPIEVTEAEKLTSGELIGTRSTTAQPTIKSRSEGIFQNITDPAEVYDQRVSLIQSAGLASGLWAVTGALIGLLQIYRRKSSDVSWVRRQQARSRASRRLTEATTLASQGNSTEALRQIRSAIVGLIADMQDRVEEGLTSADVKQALTIAAVPDSDQIEILSLLDDIESADYGGGQSIDVPAAISRSTAWISRVAPKLERGLKQ